MMRAIGDELQAKTNAIAPLSEREEEVKILDLCMAPGGFTASALKYNDTATACGITLPRTQGGHELLLQSSRYHVLFLDITMLAGEMGVDQVPPTHPEQAQFLGDRPYLGQTFHLIFCDGQVLRTHKRAEHRERQEGLRLTVSQLVFALQRIRPGGTLVMLLHKIEAWHNTELLYRFSQFSSITLFKPEKKHAIRSSFYLVAKNVQPESDRAKEAVDVWKRAWWRATFGGQNGTGEGRAMPNEGYVHAVLNDFGKELIGLGRPVWEIQANALSKMEFVK
jgi:23S rRNA U2552 (ribose-2'-O)-methylase RlmE/FtsJ